LGGHFDISKLKSDKELLENKLNNPNIWDDVEKANELNKELSNINKKVCKKIIKMF